MVSTLLVFLYASATTIVALLLLQLAVGIFRPTAWISSQSFVAGLRSGPDQARDTGRLSSFATGSQIVAPLLVGFVAQATDTGIACPPTLGLLTVNALVAATHLLIPIQSSYFALEGTDDLLETIEKVRTRANPNLQILGVLITMHDKRTSLARDIQLQIHKVFGAKVFKTVISKNVRLEESPAYRESIFSFAPDSTGAADYYSLCEEVMDRA